MYIRRRNEAGRWKDQETLKSEFFSITYVFVCVCVRFIFCACEINFDLYLFSHWNEIKVLLESISRSS